MVEAQFNMFDAAVIIVILLSTLLAFFRGFVREFLSLGAWIGAGLITMYCFEDVVKWLKPHTKTGIVAYLIGGVGTYVGSLITISLLNAIIIRYVKTGDEVGMLDNFLGMMFGVLRGAFIISLGYLVLSLVIDHENPPEWVKNAYTRPYAQQGAIWLASIAPEYLEDISSIGKKLEEKLPEIQNRKNGNDPQTEGDAQNKGDALKKEDGNADETDSDLLDEEKGKGYSESERKLLDEIMKARE